MRILLTGSHGFTGRHFIRAAIAAGHEVMPLEANLMDQAALDDETKRKAPEAVVHLAAISFVGHKNESAFYDVNVIGTLNLLRALSHLGRAPDKVLLSSSANVYGNCTVSPISESQPVAPVNHYATSKLAMEFMAKTFSDRLPIFFTRPFNYTGPGQNEAFIIPKLVSHFVRREPVVELGNLDVEREFNDVRFVCDAYLRLLEEASPGDVFNVCSGFPLALRSVIDLLANRTGHKIEVKVNPAFVRSNEIQRLCGDPSKLDNIIGPLKKPSLAETMDWMLAEYSSRSAKT